MKRNNRLEVTRFLLLVLIFILSQCFTERVKGTVDPILVTIKEDGIINPLSAPMVNEGVIYRFTGEIYGRLVVEKNDIIIDGDNQLLRGTGLESSVGITVKNMENITIKNLEIKNYGYGMVLTRSNKINIYNCDIHDNSFNGINLRETSESVIRNNNIYNNQHGLDLSEYSSNNQIYENNIGNNEYGIFIGFSSDNVIYHNNLVDNANSVYTLDSTNIWDLGYPDGGNYWSLEVTGDIRSGPNQDQPNSDGISDEPLFIDEYNADNYPLMDEYNSIPPETTKPDLVVSVIIESGEPLSEAQVLSDFQPDGQPQLSGLSDINGKVSFPSIKQGTYNLKISKEDYRSEVVIIKLEEEDKLITVILIPDRATIIFILKGENNQLLENVKVSSVIQPTGQPPLTGNTNADGTITFSDVKKGSYQWSFSKQYYKSISKELVLEDDDEIDVILKIDNVPSSGIPGFPLIAMIIGLVLYRLMYTQVKYNDEGNRN